MTNLIQHLQKHPEEATAIVSGNAVPLGMNASEIVKVIQFFSEEREQGVRGYWL